MTQQTEGGLVTGVTRHWRTRLTTLQHNQQQLAALETRTPQQEAQLQQATGAITILKAVLDDLQKIRPINQSVLNR